MASSLLALIDDIASIMDDVAVLTKVAGKNAAGVIGDDLALNAKQLAGFAADRELPILYKVAKGALINKVILVPLALIISYFMPFLVIPLLMAGGIFLCFEGVEKIHEKIHKHSPEETPEVVSEEEKIKGAIRTDFILSAEIIIIALGSVAGSPILNQVIALSLISLIMTVGVYGLVALIVKLDDIGAHLGAKKNLILKNMGITLVRVMPYFMKALGVIGTLAMFLVGGGILVHGIHPLHDLQQALIALSPSQISALITLLFEALSGVAAGALALVIVKTYKKIKS